MNSEWDAEQDLMCVSIREFFAQDKTPAITRSIEFVNGNGKQVPVGKMLYALRTRYQASTGHTPLIKLRLEALQDISALQTFLNIPLIPKKKKQNKLEESLTTTTNKKRKKSIVSTQKYQTQLWQCEEDVLKQEQILAKLQLKVAQQDLQLFNHCMKKQKKRKQSSSSDQNIHKLLAKLEGKALIEETILANLFVRTTEQELRLLHFAKIMATTGSKR